MLIDIIITAKHISIPRFTYSSCVIIKQGGRQGCSWCSNDHTHLDKCQTGYLAYFHLDFWPSRLLVFGLLTI